jgi:lantibiotic modifying enzyme
MNDLSIAAYGIASRLSAMALWHEGRCTWLGADLADDGRRVEFRALGPDVYDGSAGIGLFLAEAAASEGDPGLARSAVGAARHALTRAAGIAPEVAVGFHAGRVGIAAALARIGLLLEEEELIEEGLRLAVATVEEAPPAPGLDVVSGRAGTILGLLLMAELVPTARLVDLARSRGDELAARVLDGDHLTGLAHGAAGIGGALVELFAATGVGEYESAARRAFAYERRLFDPVARNWPDLREPGAISFRCGWCHGAPGIALSRARAVELLGDDSLREEAELGLATTERTTRLMIRSESFDFSLCHGISGNAQVLLDADEMLAGGCSARRELALDVAGWGVESHARTRRPWPCGTHVGESPGLMTGLAGIGLFLLRAAGRPVVTVLLPRLHAPSAAARTTEIGQTHTYH